MYLWVTSIMILSPRRSSNLPHAHLCIFAIKDNIEILTHALSTIDLKARGNFIFVLVYVFVAVVNRDSYNFNIIITQSSDYEEKTQSFIIFAIQIIFSSLQRP